MLLAILAENLERLGVTDALLQSFAKVNTEVGSMGLDIEFSGSTCAAVLVRGQSLYTANVGDSRAIVGSLEDTSIRGHAITRDHKPTEPDEAARIASAGGRIEAFKGKRLGYRE